VVIYMYHGSGCGVHGSDFLPCEDRVLDGPASEDKGPYASYPEYSRANSYNHMPRGAVPTRARRRPSLTISSIWLGRFPGKALAFEALAAGTGSRSSRDLILF